MENGSVICVEIARDIFREISNVAGDLVGNLPKVQTFFESNGVFD